MSMCLKQDVQIIEEDFIDQPLVKLLVNTKALLMESNKKKRHDHDSQDTGFLKRRICSACRCALKRNNPPEVKITEEDLIDQQFVKLFAKVKALLLEFNKTNKT